MLKKLEKRFFVTPYLYHNYNQNRVYKKTFFSGFLNFKKKEFGQCAISNSGMTSVLSYTSEKLNIFDFFGILGFFQAQEKLSFTMKKNAKTKVVITNALDSVT